MVIISGVPIFRIFTVIQSNLTSKWLKEIDHQTCYTETSLKEQLNGAIHICPWLIFYILLSLDTLHSPVVFILNVSDQIGVRIHSC